MQSSDIGKIPVIDTDKQADLDRWCLDSSQPGGGLVRPLGADGMEGYGYAGVANPFPQNLLISRNDIADVVREAERQKSDLRSLIEAKKIPYKNQQRTNYCWIFAVVHALELQRVQQNLPYVSLSPASGGARIKNFRNVGGWGREAIEFIAEHGVCRSKTWPDAVVDRRYDTAASRQEAKSYTATDWYYAPPRNKDYLFSALSRRMPCPVGYNWWGHEVLGIQGVILDNELCLLIRNSWPQWGVNGFGILRGSRMIPDDLVMLAGAKASLAQA